MNSPWKSDINVTPLVDVMLVLLIIFMLVTPMLQQDTEVILPQAANVVPFPDQDENSITLTLHADGEMDLEGEPLVVPLLRSRLEIVRAGKPMANFLLKADRNVDYGAVKKAFRSARDAGFENVYLVAKEAGS